jgi:hypothetical protein
MANLIYSAITSLDGYVADEDGNFDWAAPDVSSSSSRTNAVRQRRRVPPLPHRDVRHR